MARLRIATESRAETVQAREIFHLTDFESSKRQDRGVVLEHLTSAITRHTRSSFSSLVAVAAYKKINNIYAGRSDWAPFAVVMRGVVRNINLRNKA
jgi:hypothetical protein